jgi:hypothetical protein
MLTGCPFYVCFLEISPNYFTNQHGIDGPTDEERKEVCTLNMLKSVPRYSSFYLIPPYGGHEILIFVCTIAGGEENSD